jgi:hypothetical protein
VCVCACVCVCIELLNGAYWKSMQRDGWNDRMTPATEAYEQQKAGTKP